MQTRIYDYLGTERENPNRPVDDDTLPGEDENSLRSSTFALSLYTIGGFLIFFFTRLAYDKEWDRFYHVNYPASMEFYDVLSRYYDRKKQDFIRHLPESINEGIERVFPKMKKQEEEIVGSEEKKRSEGADLEIKIGQEMAKMLGDEGLEKFKVSGQDKDNGDAIKA